MGGAGGSGPWLDPGVVSPAPAPQLSPIGMRPPPIFGNVRGNAMLDPGMTGGPDLYASMQELVAAPPPQQQDIPSYIAAQLMA